MSTLIAILCCYGYVVFVRLWALKPLPSIIKWGRLKHLEKTPRWITATYPTALVITFYVLLRLFFVDVTLIPSESMAPTIGRNSVWLINKSALAFDYRMVDGEIAHSPSVQPGDIVFFRAPNNPEVTLVKRLVGRPGDRIDISANQIAVNGRLLLNSKTGKGILRVRGKTMPVILRKAQIASRSYEVATAPDPNWPTTSVVLGANEYYVLGDNLDASEDSRYFGIVPGHYLLGTLLTNVMEGEPFIDYSSD